MDTGRAGETAWGRGPTGQAAATAAPPAGTPPASQGAGQGAAATPEELARQAREAAAGVAQDVAQEVQRQTTARLGEQVGRAAERLGGVSQAVQAVGRQLREQDDTATAVWVERAADQVDRLADYLRGKDVDELVYEGERFARRQPALFLGGAFALGLLAARFLKSSGGHDARYAERDWLAHYGRPPRASGTVAPPAYGVTAPFAPPAPPSGPHAGSRRWRSRRRSSARRPRASGATWPCWSPAAWSATPVCSCCSGRRCCCWRGWCPSGPRRCSSAPSRPGSATRWCGVGSTRSRRPT
jgi:hypothetical protein